jgi:uncharacterized membrane protein
VKLKSMQTQPPSIHAFMFPSIMLEELFDDFFTPIARDGARMIEVQIRLQKALKALRQIDGTFCANAQRHSHSALHALKLLWSLMEIKKPCKGG